MKKEAISHQDIFNRFLLNKLSERRFLQDSKAGHGIPHYICPFDPAYGMRIEEDVRRLKDKLGEKGIRVLHISLFTTAMEILNDNDVLGPAMEMKMESQADRNDFISSIRSMLDPEDIVRKITDRTQENEYDILFISGVGDVFPFLRTHSLLTTMGQYLCDRPMLLFFPGNYTSTETIGSSLDLFGRMGGDGHYRSRNILELME